MSGQDDGRERWWIEAQVNNVLLLRCDLSRTDQEKLAKAIAARLIAEPLPEEKGAAA